MIQKIKRLALALVAAVTIAAPLAVPAVAYAATSSDLQSSVCSGANLNLGPPDSSCVTDSSPNDTVNETITLGLNIFSAIVGIIAVVMIIVGGIKYITSSGDSGNITSAKNTIMYAVIGLVVVALAQIIVKFVLERFVGGSA